MGFPEIAAFFMADAFIANSIPHIANGTCGKKFPERSPFKKASGEESAFEVFLLLPIGNVLWGVCNVSIGLVMVSAAGDLRIGLTLATLVFMMGLASVAAFLAWNIGGVHYKKDAV